MLKIKILIKTLLIFLAVLLIMIIVQACLAFIGFSLTQNPANPTQLFLERISPVIVAVLLILWAKKYKQKLYKRLLKTIQVGKETIQILSKTIFMVLGVLYLLFGFSELLNYSTFIHLGIVEYSSVTIIKQALLVGILGNIFVAIGEEIIFRGFLLNYFHSISKSKIFALLFTSILFSLHPYHDFLNYVIAFITGLILGYSYLKFKTLSIPVAIHFAYNIFNFTIASKPSYGPQLPYIIKFDFTLIKSGFGAWVDLFIIIGLLLIFLILWYLPSNSIRREVKMV